MEVKPSDILSAMLDLRIALGALQVSITEVEKAIQKLTMAVVNSEKEES